MTVSDLVLSCSPRDCEGYLAWLALEVEVRPLECKRVVRRGFEAQVPGFSAAAAPRGLPGDALRITTAQRGNARAESVAL